MGARAVIIALADMPLVTAAHIEALAAGFDGNLIASRVGGRKMPPAIFAASHFAALTALGGDRGAGGLLADAPSLPLSPDEALDIDFAEDLAKAADLLANR